MTDENGKVTCRHAAESMDCQLSSGTLDAAMAKRYATDACCKIADDAMQVILFSELLATCGDLT